MFLTSGFNAGTAAMGAGVAVLLLVFIVIIYALDFLFTMFVYNNIAPKSSNFIRILCTGIVCFVINIVISYISSLINKTGMPAFSLEVAIQWLVDAIIGVAIAKFCTDRFNGSLWTKSLKGAVLYLVISVILTIIFAAIFGGAVVGGFLPAAMQGAAA